MDQSAANLTLYLDFGSQPSRAVYSLLAHHSIPFTLIEVKIINNEHKSDYYAQINPNKKVPAITDVLPNGNTFKLSESHAIMRYLCATREAIPESYYPKGDIIRRSQIDYYLDWHHGNIRAGNEGYVMNRFIKPFITGRKTDDKVLKESMGLLKKSMQMLETYWLRDGQKYLVGDKISIADLACAAEVGQIGSIEGILEDIGGFREKYKRVYEWLERIETEIPALGETNFTSNLMLEQFWEMLENKISPKL
ncbi:hypothetical protein FGO68_gene12999 [Halteria grandinella]|uniref:Glutathione S-transferase n=1 Tax=Halteria grandinella TaxID=5974 RepID=A0A8J8SYU9_HALGN|nr:hypothetical protein FGO68_gene12999 [Halteria grandinella]